MPRSVGSGLMDDIAGRARQVADAIQAGLDGHVAAEPAEPLGELRDGGTSPAEPDNWPQVDPAALHGLAGDVVRTIEPHTEGDPVAVLGNTLAMFGSALNRGPYAPVGATRHHANLYAVVVGDSARGRKGTAYAEPRRLMRIADKEWAA